MKNLKLNAYLNPKSKILNSKQIQNPKVRIFKNKSLILFIWVLVIRALFRI
jgi:hypothetical protein